MAQPRKSQNRLNLSAKEGNPNINQPAIDTVFTIRYPYIWLSVIVLLVFMPVFRFGYADFDDGIFINTLHSFNEHLGNVFTAFRESVFMNPEKDIYYRPLFNISMILNNKLSGQDITGYHAVNVLLHLCAVLLLYLLFVKLELKKLHSFILALVFALHPALVMAIAWVPGRNDILLAIFSFAFLIQAITFSDTGAKIPLVLSAIFLCLAFFTKESAVLMPPTAFVLLVMVKQKKWLDTSNLIQYAVWATCFGIWYIMRATAHVATMKTPVGSIMDNFVNRLPVLVQYTGKALIPFNLSVFPNMNDTAYYPGILAITLLVVIIYLNKQRNIRIILAGLFAFFLLLLPVLFIPDYINKQTFEHRLYLPIIGILLILPQTILLNNRLHDKQLLAYGTGLCCLLAFLNLQYQKSFETPENFWTNAVKTSPSSSYAHMMLSARTGDQAKSRKLFLKAYELNPREHYVNYIYATMLQEKDSILESEKYLLTEKEVTGFNKCDLLLARVERAKKNDKKAMGYLETYLNKEPLDTSSNLNLLLLYMEADEDIKAIKQERHMDSMHMAIPPIIRSQIKHY